MVMSDLHGLDIGQDPIRDDIDRLTKSFEASTIDHGKPTSAYWEDNHMV